MATSTVTTTWRTRHMMAAAITRMKMRPQMRYQLSLVFSTSPGFRAARGNSCEVGRPGAGEAEVTGEGAADASRGPTVAIGIADAGHCPVAAGVGEQRRGVRHDGLPFGADEAGVAGAHALDALGG